MEPISTAKKSEQFTFWRNPLSEHLRQESQHPWQLVNFGQMNRTDFLPRH